MMKNSILYITFFFVCISCNNVSNQQATLDSLKKEKETADYIDSRLIEMQLENVKAAAASPVSIKDADIINGNIHINIKNEAQQDIDAIKFGFYAYDNFKKPVPDGYSNFQSGIWQGLIKPGEEQSLNFELTGKETATNIEAFVSEIHFTNDSIWTFEAKQ